MVWPEHVRLLSHDAARHVGRLLLVRVGVLDHPVLADEALAAGVAGEGLLPRVEAHVPPEVSLVVELLRAHLALVGLVAGVLSQVFLKQNKCYLLLRQYKKKNISWFFDDPLFFSIFLFYYNRKSLKNMLPFFRGGEI